MYLLVQPFDPGLFYARQIGPWYFYKATYNSHPTAKVIYPQRFTPTIHTRDLDERVRNEHKMDDYCDARISSKLSSLHRIDICFHERSFESPEGFAKSAILEYILVYMIRLMIASLWNYKLSYPLQYICV